MGEHAESQVREKCSAGFGGYGKFILCRRNCRGIDQYFNGERQEFTFVPYLYGAEFYKTVWKALMQVPMVRLSPMENWRRLRAFLWLPVRWVAQWQGIELRW